MGNSFSSEAMMKIVALLTNVMMLVACAGAQATDKSENGFVSLFNGQNLDGWVGATDDYRAHEGTIHMPAGGKGNLFYHKEFSDFVLHFEFKLTPGANNGLGIRSPLKGDPAYAGIELQILDDDHPKWADLQDWQYHGAAYGIAPAKRGALKPAGEWNRQEVTVRGREIKIVLNGHTILDINLDEAMRDGTLDGKEHPGAYRDRGHIGFLGHNDEVWFRNIRIKELQ